MDLQSKFRRYLKGDVGRSACSSRRPHDYERWPVAAALGLLLVFVGGISDSRAQDGGRVTSVEVYRGQFATVNSYIVSNGSFLTVIDVQRKADEARSLVKQIKEIGLPVEQILITHGHTDHFTGMPVMKKAFPDARIVVANTNVRDEIKAYAVYMDGFGATAAEPPLDPSLKPLSAHNPTGFDYESQIKILSDDSRLMLRGGGELLLETDYLPAEADTMTTVYSPDLNALFLSDFAYNRVHHWQGDDISYQDIANWRSEILRIKDMYLERYPVVYPGHGEPGDLSMIDEMVTYIDDYVRVTKSSRSPQDAMDEMIRLYPLWGEADFFLKYSVFNHVRPSVP